MRICRTILPLVLAGCMGSQMTPSINGARLSSAAVRPFAKSPHCPQYSKGTGLLIDGDFRAAVDPGGGYRTYAKGQHAAFDWTVTANTIDLAGTTFWSFRGLCSVDLDGTSAVGGIEHHAFATQKGGSYTLSFLMSGNSYCGAAVKKMRVSVGNQSVVFKWNVSNGHSVENGKVALRHVKFKAVGSASTLKFTSLDQAGSGCGPVIGAVSVTKT